jgi:hypothetical protein
MCKEFSTYLVSKSPREWLSSIEFTSRFQAAMAIVLLGFTAHALNSYTDPRLPWPYAVPEVPTASLYNVTIIFNGDNCGVIKELYGYPDTVRDTIKLSFQRTGYVDSEVDVYLNGTQATSLKPNCCPNSAKVGQEPAYDTKMILTCLLRV